MSYGVTSTGFVKKDLEAVIDEIGDDEQDLISAILDLLPSGPVGQLNGIFGDKLREMWEVAEAVYRSHYPDSASGEALDQVASYTGAIRLAATESEVTLNQMFLDNGVTVPAGSIVSVGSEGTRFVTNTAITNSTGYPATLSVEAEASETGPLNGYAGTIDTIQTAISGWKAACAITCANSATFALDGTSLTLKVDRGSEQTVTFSGGDPWSAASVASEIESQTTDVDAYAVGDQVRVSSLTEGTGSAIEITGGTANAVLGFDTDEVKGFNSNDAVSGRDIETDPDFRLRRIELLRGIGKATLEALRAAVRGVDDVLQVMAFENTAEIPSPVGIPPHSFELIVQGGADQDIADTIWDTKPAAIKPSGIEAVAVEDSQGFEHTMYFSRPIEIPIYINCILTTDPDEFPANGIDQVKQALKDYGDTLAIGEDVVILQFKAIPLTISGVIDVPIFYIDTVDPPTGESNIPIGYRSLSTYDTSDIEAA